MSHFLTHIDQLDSAIRQHRTAHITLTVSNQDAPIANQEIVVEQKQHKFLFGGTWDENSVALANGDLSGKKKELAEQRNYYFSQLCNQVTLPFYWARFEPQRGQPQTGRILSAARWYRDQGCVTKGHPLCWHTLTANWLLTMNNRDILQDQVARIQRDVTDFLGIIDVWDVVNEAVIMPIFDKYDNGITRLCKELGRIELIRMMFNATRAANPNATLLLNDFDVSPAYDILVEGCLEAGIQIDVIGIQSHMHQGYWGVEKTLYVLEQFERFGLPIHFTENTIVSGQIMPPEIVDLNDYQVDEWPTTSEGEDRQAQEVVSHYKTLFSHPNVEAITWWGLPDGGWLKAPSGLLRQDYSPKPAYDELLKLVKGEWWLEPTGMMTDGNGQLSFTGILGTYELTVGNQTLTFSVPETGEAEVVINL
ncbi:MAG TPA: endo-1,4-beta-xylanase [Phototrophicaceae bacterium]|nr:endo-1,4-beta-xylanase [Phototrophicaceae bacterium]